MFPELHTSVSPDDREHLVLRAWKNRNIFKRSVEERPEETPFSFYEGPPTVNGVPGIHHVFSRSIKDMICRYQTMLGKRVERKAGWDTHGLPVELAIERQLGFRHKDEIKEYGVDKFNEMCKASVYENIERDSGWRALTERMAYWADMDHPYITCTNEYIESVWWALKQFFEAGKIYKGFKIQPYCPRCETALSSHEVALGYKQAKDPSVFVKFRRKNVSEEEYFLAWTTTPWTLISNAALAVNPDVDYVTVINTRKNSTERLILAEALLEKLDGEYEVLYKYQGSKLEGAEYEPLFPYFSANLDPAQRAFYVVLGNYVTTEDGTGIVHTAPAFGEDDFQVSQKYGLPLFNAVDQSGNFIPAITEFAGQFVKEADQNIVEVLKKRGQLYRKETLEHTYPFCWRCDTPLLYYARTAWYIRVTDYKKQLSETNKTINWNPPEIRDGRFGNWLDELKDWGLSRERFWGTPLPIWECKNCDHRKCVGSVEEYLAGKFKDKTPMQTRAKEHRLQLHKPEVDNVYFECEKCGELMQRVPDVIDVWFDSGSMPFAQFHYPFENKEKFEKSYPAQFISEGIDQTRGWFYTLHAINTFLFGKPAYENVIVNDMLLDKKGQKMSKSKGNIVNPFDILSKYGADATRWYLIASSVPWKPKAFNEDDLAEVERKFFGTLMNTYGFFALYANIDAFTYDETKRTPISGRPEVDRWILSELHSLTADCRASFSAYDLTKPARAIQDFVSEQLSNWYVRRNRRRFWKGENNADKQAAYETLYECLMTVARLMAPLAPFMADVLHGALGQGTTGSVSDSVHLDLYPDVNRSLIDQSLEERMKIAQRISSLARQMREKAKLRVRQPLERILIPIANRHQAEELRKVEDIIREEINVKHVELIERGDSEVIKLKAKANFKLLGSRLGKQMKTVAARIAQFSQDEIREYQQHGSLQIEVDGETYKLEYGEIDVVAEDVEGWLVSSEGGLTVALDTHLTDALLGEGLAREFVNRVQNLRKDSGFEVTDRIVIHIANCSDVLAGAINSHEQYIVQETLASAVVRRLDGDSERDHATMIDILGETAVVSLDVKREK